MNISLSHTEFYTAQVPILGSTFQFKFDKKPNKKKIVNNLDKFVANILSTIVEVQSEWGRKDGKKVILFYTRKDHCLVSFVFAVEADTVLNELMKHSQDNFAQIINYVQNNYKNLNFNT